MADPFSTDHDNPFIAPDDRRGLLIVADGDWIDDAAMLAHAAGLRLLGTVPLDQAAARLDMQVGCDVVLLLCRQPDPLLERLIVQVETIAIQNRMAVVLLAGIETLDMAYACMRSPQTQLLCCPDNGDIAAALLAAAHGDAMPHNLHDATHESDGNRLQRLSEEVSRLARTIEALTDRPRPTLPAFDMPARIADRQGGYAAMPAIDTIGAATMSETAPITAAQVRDMLRARRLRADFLPGDLFADPAWDMMLDLLAARLEQAHVSVSSLCIASAVPPTTALRWIRTLTDKALVERRADPHDGRRIFIALADDAAEKLMRWFGASRRYLGT